MDKYPIVPGRGLNTRIATDQRRSFIKDMGNNLQLISQSAFQPHQIINNIESYIGSVEIPLGLIGPLLFNNANNSEYVYAPAATTEGALIASINRGAKVVSLSGGITAEVIHQKMIRCPLFMFKGISESVVFRQWVLQKFEEIKAITCQYSNHAKLQTIEPVIAGWSVHLKFVYTTGDASGQNMTTKCTWHAVEWINENFTIESGIKPLHFIIEGNGASDKKVSNYAMSQGRGVHVIAECELDERVIKKVLRVSSDDFLRYFNSSMIMSRIDGMVGYNINSVNVVAAIFAATGQDLASIHESGAGILSMEKTTKGIYFCLHLPSLVIGTIGGGTRLPKQQEALEFMNCTEKGSLPRLAKIIAGFALSLEISTFAAIVGGQFVRAHEKLGRNKPIKWLTKSEINLELLKNSFNNNFPFKDIQAIKLWDDHFCENGIMINLTNNVTDKLTGFFIAEVISNEPFETNNSEFIQNGNSGKFLIKSKPLDDEVIKGLKLLASAIDNDLTPLFSTYKKNLEYKNSHKKEWMIYEALTEKGFSCIPKYYGKKIIEEREVYLIFMELLDFNELLFINTENNTEKWNDELIFKVIKDITEIHLSFKTGDNSLILNEFEISKPWKAKELYQKLLQITTLEYHAESWIGLIHNLIGYADKLQDEYLDIKIEKTLTHNDFNSRNIAIRKNGDSCIYDWELAMINFPHRDIVEFLSFVLPENFDDSRLMNFLQYHYEISKATESWDTWKLAYIYSLKEFLVTRVSFYLTGKIVLDFNFAVRVLKTACRIINILEKN